MAETDIVERLRHCSENCGDEYLRELSGRAADEITRLRAALREIANRRDYQIPNPQDIARAALEGRDE